MTMEQEKIPMGRGFVTAEPARGAGAGIRETLRPRLSRGAQLYLLAAIVSVPWLDMVIGVRSWPAWLLAVVVFLGSRWLLDRLTHPSDLRERLAALEEREAVRRFPAREEREEEHEEHEL